MDKFGLIDLRHPEWVIVNSLFVALFRVVAQTVITIGAGFLCRG